MSVRAFSLFLGRRSQRANDLGRMSLRELVLAYVTYPTIILYGVLIVLCAAGAIWLGALERPGRTIATLLTALLVYPFFEYGLHRFVLHNRGLYKNPLTAGLWKRIHYDHHQDPNRLDVLFGSPGNTLPAIFAPSLLIGYLIGGWSAALACCAMSLVLFSFYEFCHCVQHLNYTPKSGWLRTIKKQHMSHHFHNETGNFGITTTVVDRLVGTFYASNETRSRSTNVYDLGYDQDEAARYPWVAMQSAPARSRPGAG